MSRCRFSFARATGYGSRRRSECNAGSISLAVSYIGAGVYEEVMFRLLLVPAAFLCFRMFEFPPKYAAAMAAISTSFFLPWLITWGQRLKRSIFLHFPFERRPDFSSQRCSCCGGLGLQSGATPRTTCSSGSCSLDDRQRSTQEQYAAKSRALMSGETLVDSANVTSDLSGSVFTSRSSAADLLRSGMRVVAV